MAVTTLPNTFWDPVTGNASLDGKLNVLDSLTQGGGTAPRNAASIATIGSVVGSSASVGFGPLNGVMGTSGFAVGYANTINPDRGYGSVVSYDHTTQMLIIGTDYASPSDGQTVILWDDYRYSLGTVSSVSIVSGTYHVQCSGGSAGRDWASTDGVWAGFYSAFDGSNYTVLGLGNIGNGQAGFIIGLSNSDAGFVNFLIGQYHGCSPDSMFCIVVGSSNTVTGSGNVIIGSGLADAGNGNLLMLGMNFTVSGGDQLSIGFGQEQMIMDGDGVRIPSHAGQAGQFFVPSYTTAERDALIVNYGSLIYNSTTDKGQMYSNSGWRDLW